MRAALSESLKFVIAQRLLPSKEPRKQVAAFEVLRNTVAVANMIREEKTFQIPSAMQIGKSQGMQTFDDALKALVTRRPASAARPPTAPPPRRRTSRRSCPAALRPLRLRRARGEEAMSSAASASAPKIDRFLRLMTSRGASDFHLTVGRPPMLRVSGSIEPIRYRTLSEADFVELLRPIVPERLWEEFAATGDVDLAYEIAGARALPRQPVPPAARLGRRVPRDPLEDHDARAARHAGPGAQAAPRWRTAWCW